MPDQNNNQPNSTSPSDFTDGKREPAIRTMKSDVSEYFKKSKPSLTKLVGMEVAENPPERTSKRKQKTFLVAGAVVGIFLLSALAFFFLGGNAFKNGEEGILPARPDEPLPLFAVENSRTIEADTANQLSFLRLIEGVARTKGRRETFEHLILKLHDGPQERFATLTDFFTLYRIEPPPNTFTYAEGPVMLFFYHDADAENHFGFATKSRDPERTLRDLLIWESSLAGDILSLFFTQNPEPARTMFEDRTYRNIDWRFLSLSQENDLGIGHVVFLAKNVVVLTTSEAAMKKVIDRLFDSR